MTGIKGLREINKKEKLQRIQQSARQLFREKGFEATTTKEIAELAGVGTGTLFLYVKDKEELLVMLYLNTLDREIEEAFATLPAEAGLLDKLVYLFGSFLKFYAQDIETACAYLKAQLFHYDIQGYRLQAALQIRQFSARVNELLVQAKKSGQIRAEVDTIQASTNLFALYYSVLTGMLSGWFEVDQAVNVLLPGSFQLQLQGF